MVSLGEGEEWCLKWKGIYQLSQSQKAYTCFEVTKIKRYYDYFVVFNWLFEMNTPRAASSF